mmetsp:Transcript_7911/g.13110  ORF Transcript_7911/g.13110 Transcript_7911/m.13110 type:complete len:630 (+) Transcript_7911:171-2060(+)|eukprot:CAMPEP_0174963594 /NCGR_PEP_ID=MMETSP0004_2-20121128/5415_1 /TAXON_ID=420556 /ORGANISM="Ochromonas sp., Strain CCMP1393" /LENGTH=629 /DNA_ID=CAMNT_0016212233 /DNA_START=149 /DNA_END=2038 /DNA_ORIENTATION=-
MCASSLYAYVCISALIISAWIQVCYAELPIVDHPDITLDTDLILYVDPPNGHSSPHAMAAFARASDPAARVYYDEFGRMPFLNGTFLTYNTPYIQLDTPFQASRNRTLVVVAVVEDETGIYRSEQYVLDYFVEGSDRPDSFGFLVPGIESGGYFVRYGIEIKATARAQVAGGQEFADFFTNLGIGTYPTQIQALDLTALDPDLMGFEGGFPVNTSDNRHYGILIPFHNGEDFFGKVVRVDLQAMANASICAKSYYMERLDADGNLEINSTANASSACIHVMDLASKFPEAVGFRRGFMGYPYGYLSAGHYSMVARLDLENYGIMTTRLIDLSILDVTYGGYSGGFMDGTWACFNPFLSFSGPIGGVRSTHPVDANHLRPYYYGVVICVNASAWSESIATNATLLSPHVQIIDLSGIEDGLRGFSDAIRVGRFAYLSPYQSADNVFASKLIRISLGVVDIGTTLTQLAAAGTDVRTIVDILDLSKKDESLRGYSGLFYSGRNLFLVPFRNVYEPENGQRGHGLITRLNMNDFEITGVDFIDIPTTIRTQIPSFPDFSLRGFMGGFASGHYGMLVPFFNADFNGLIARFKTMDDTLDTNLQELDLMQDRERPNVYRGFRFGFVSLWQGVEF